MMSVKSCENGPGVAESLLSESTRCKRSTFDERCPNENDSDCIRYLKRSSAPAQVAPRGGISIEVIVTFDRI
jgi:hypothetical protein